MKHFIEVHGTLTVVTYGVPAPAELRGVTVTLHAPLVSLVAEHVTLVVEVLHAKVLEVRPSVAFAEYVTEATRVKDAESAPFDVDIRAPAGLDGRAEVGVPVDSVAVTDSSATTRIVGEENVKPLASMRKRLLSELMEVVETLDAPVESSMTDTLNCFVEVILGPQRH